VATMTSLTGFEALLRGKAVTCYGMPFYAGWGLTTDRGGTSARRKARPNLDALTHACLIDYPLYWDPMTGAPCGVETLLDRFEQGSFSGRQTPRLRILAKLQGIFSSFAHLWR
ncbi:MAG: beta-3-deoxy-D-manno-oct-2-ulosonic acid transferase, partial [Rhodobacteraceae bacterium]